MNLARRHIPLFASRRATQSVRVDGNDKTILWCLYRSRRRENTQQTEDSTTDGRERKGGRKMYGRGCLQGCFGYPFSCPTICKGPASPKTSPRRDRAQSMGGLACSNVGISTNSKLDDGIGSSCLARCASTLWANGGRPLSHANHLLQILDS